MLVVILTRNNGQINIYESCALYAEGIFGTIPEFYVRPDWRSSGI